MTGGSVSGCRSFHKILRLPSANIATMTAIVFLSRTNASLTFPPAAELDSELLVHVLAQVEDVLLLWSLSLSRRTSALCASTASPSSPAVAAASTASSASELASLRHCIGVVWAECGDVTRRELGL
jgi:hypothetical protein